MNFKMHDIQIIFKNKEILFYLDNKAVGQTPYSCEIFQDKAKLNKENFDELYAVLQKEIKKVTKGFIFRPTLSMDVTYIDSNYFLEIHQQFFTELGLCLPVKNVELLDDNNLYSEQKIGSEQK